MWCRRPLVHTLFASNQQLRWLPVKHRVDFKKAIITLRTRLFFPACLPTFVLVCLPFHSFFRAFKNYSAVRSIGGCPHFILTAAVLALQLELSPSSSPNMDHSRHILSSSQDQLFQQATRASQCLSACAPEKSAFADHRVRL